MNVSLASGFARTALDGSAAAKGLASGQDAKSAKAARDFEAVLLTPVFDALQRTFAGDAADDKTVGASDFRQMGSQAMAEAVAARGGLGIAKMLLQHLRPPKVAGEG